MMHPKPSKVFVMDPLPRVINTAQKITGHPLPSLKDLYSTQHTGHLSSCLLTGDSGAEVTDKYTQVHLLIGHV